MKTIQMAVSQRLLPLRCVICRAKILRLKQTLIPRDVSTNFINLIILIIAIGNFLYVTIKAANFNVFRIFFMVF